MSSIKNDLSKYVWSAVGGAVVAVVAGLWMGPLTTSGNAEAMVTTATENRDVAFCTANARKLIAQGEQPVPGNLTEARAVAGAALEDLMPEERFAIRLLRQCAREIQG